MDCGPLRARKPVVEPYQTRYCSFFTTDCKHDIPVFCVFRKTTNPKGGPSPLRQRTITDMLGKTRSRRTSILTLPPTLRRDIYLYAGIPYAARIVIQPGFEYETIEKHEFKAITALRLTSRLISDEVTAVVFSDNHFVIYHATPGDLQPLRDFSPQMYRSLRRLELHIQFVPCDYTDGCQHIYRQQRAPDVLLDCRSHKNVDMYQEWLYTARYFAGLIPPRHSELRFHCVVKTLIAAQTCLKPFVYIPDLSESVISFQCQDNEQASELANSVSLQKTAWRSTFLCFSSLFRPS